MARSMRDILEVVAAILLGLISVATAFGAYQASVWSGEAGAYAALSQQLRDRNLSEALTAQLIYLDDGGKLLDLVGGNSEIILFPEREAEVRENQRVLLESMTPELAEGWAAWTASGQAADMGPDTPEYYAALFAETRSLQYSSLVAHDAAESVSAKADQVTIASVIFAIALFLLGVAGVNSSWKIAAGLTGGALLAFLTGVTIVLLGTV